MDALLFWKSLSIGMAVAVPVGPMSLLCIHLTLDHGRVAGLVLGALTFAAGVFAGSMLWWTILTTLVSKSAALLQPSVMLWLNRISGAVLIGFALYGFATLT